MHFTRLNKNVTAVRLEFTIQVPIIKCKWVIFYTSNSASTIFANSQEVNLIYIFLMIERRLRIFNELEHNKTSKITCAPSDDSYQPGHPSSLIRDFSVHFIGG